MVVCKVGRHGRLVYGMKNEQHMAGHGWWDEHIRIIFIIQNTSFEYHHAKEEQCSTKVSCYVVTTG